VVPAADLPSKKPQIVKPNERGIKDRIVLLREDWALNHTLISEKFINARPSHSGQVLNMSHEVLEEMKNAVVNFDVERAVESARKALEMGIDPIEVIEGGLTKGLRIIGEKFEKGELYIMHIVAAAEAARRAIDEVLQPEILKRKAERKALGRVVIGTVAGDIHEIGKNLVAVMLFIAGFEVFDLGRDVPVEEFVKKAKDVNADIVATSALLSTTLLVQREIIEALEAAGIRDKVKVIVGGAPVTQEWAERIGADGYGADAMEAVSVAKRLLGVE
jgi:trimethylamine corrinoid protein